jgi:DNA-binding NtrC family response regulator
MCKGNEKPDGLYTIIVEDEDMIGDLIVEFLQLKGNYDPICLCKSYDGLHKERLTADLYIFDHDNKYGISGSQFLAKHNIPKEQIILTSGKDSWSHIPQFEQYKFLPKPFSIQDFYKLLD